MVEDDLPPINAELKEILPCLYSILARRRFVGPSSIATEESVGLVSSILDPRFLGVQVSTCCGHSLGQKEKVKWSTQSSNNRKQVKESLSSE